MRRGEHDRIDIRVGQHVRKARRQREAEAVDDGALFHRVAGDRRYKADFAAFPVNRLDQPSSPAAGSAYGRAQHVPSPLNGEPKRAPGG
jgi:hypothetical protein